MSYENSCPSSFVKNLAEVALNHVPAAALHQLEHFRRLPADVATKGGWISSGVDAGEQLMQRIKHLVEHQRQCVQVSSIYELIHSTPQETVLLANDAYSVFCSSQLFRQVIHGDAAEAMSKKMAPRRVTIR